MLEHENSSDHKRAFKEWKILEMTLNKGKKPLTVNYKNKLWKTD